MHYMDKPIQKHGETFARKVLIPYWFEIISGIVVGTDVVLIFAKKVLIS